MQPIIIRNTWIVVALYLLAAAGLLFLAGCGAMMAIYEWFLQKLSFFSILGGAQWGVAAWCFWLLAAQMFRVAMRTHFRQARLDEKGVDFRLGSRKKPITQYFAWNEIAAVMHRHLPMNQCYAVVAKDKRQVEFTLLTFFRAKKLAQLIADHVGQPVRDF